MKEPMSARLDGARGCMEGKNYRNFMSALYTGLKRVLNDHQSSVEIAKWFVPAAGLSEVSALQGRRMELGSEASGKQW